MKCRDVCMCVHGPRLFALTITVNVNCQFYKFYKNEMPLAQIQIHFISQSDGIWVNLSVDRLEMSIHMKSSSPLNPSLTQEGWDPHLTSWPEDSAAGPLHCHNYGGVSCVDAEWKGKRGKWSEHGREEDSVTEMMQRGWGG